MVKLYSAGYQRLDLAAFCRFVEAQNLVVVDVRLKPVSRNFQWNKNNLAKLLGARYVWVEELGNLNYKGGPIALKDEETGLARLQAVLTKSDALVLCVCADPSICHRTIVIARLVDSLHPEFSGLEVRDLKSLVDGTPLQSSLL